MKDPLGSVDLVPSHETIDPLRSVRNGNPAIGAHRHAKAQRTLRVGIG